MSFATSILEKIRGDLLHELDYDLKVLPELMQKVDNLRDAIKVCRERIAEIDVTLKVLSGAPEHADAEQSTEHGIDASSSGPHAAYASASLKAQVGIKRLLEGPIQEEDGACPDAADA